MSITIKGKTPKFTKGKRVAVKDPVGGGTFLVPVLTKDEQKSAEKRRARHRRARR